MAVRFISETTEGCRIEAAYVIRAKELRTARTGDTYLRLELADRTGVLPAVAFRPPVEVSEIPVGVVVNVRGNVSMFRGAKRAMLEYVSAASEWDPADFIAEASSSRDEAKAAFKRIIRSIQDDTMRSIIRCVFGAEGTLDRFALCPGSQSHHHAYLGGLLEHTCAVATTCDQVSSVYAGVDRDLLVTAALLHDVGKIDELTWDTAIAYTDEGRLLGHVVLGDRIVTSAASRAGVEGERLTRLQHAILSHHGELEWGSPKRPATLEALLLHHVDNMDAKATGLSELLGGAVAADERWTDAANMFHRPLHVPRSAEDDRPRSVTDDDLNALRSA